MRKALHAWLLLLLLGGGVLLPTLAAPPRVALAQAATQDEGAPPPLPPAPGDPQPADGSDAGTEPQPTHTAQPVASAQTATRAPTTEATNAPATANVERSPAPAPTAPPTPRPDELPDAAEPNNERSSARQLPMNAVSGLFTFVPENDRDWYRIDTGDANNGLPTAITVRSTGGLELITTVYREADAEPLAVFASPQVSTTLGTDVGGAILLQVENRALGVGGGQSYRVEVRRVLPPPPAPHAVSGAAAQPDALENNWSFDTAAPIAVGVSYDLTFACPDLRPNACDGGDHDYLRFGVKQGLEYVLTTYDLHAGVDTVVDLYYGSETAAMASCDDTRPGGGMLSTIRWTATGDGEAVVRIAPRDGGLAPRVVGNEGGNGYRFAIAVAGTVLAQQLEARIVEQTTLPTPTPEATGEKEPTPAPAPVAHVTPEPTPQAPAPAPVAPVPQESAPPSSAALEPSASAVQAEPSSQTRLGQAQVITDTDLRTAPRDNAQWLERLGSDLVVALLGPVRGAWVKIETPKGVIPGWVYGPFLQRIGGGGATATNSTGDAGTDAGSTGDAGNGAGSTVVPAATGTPISTPEPLPNLRPLDLAPLPTLPLPPARRALSVTVQLVMAVPRAPVAPGRVAPTAQPPLPLSGVRVELVNAFGDVLLDAVSDDGGQVRFITDRDEATAVWVRVPLAGLQVPVTTPADMLKVALPSSRPTPGGGA